MGFTRLAEQAAKRLASCCWNNPWRRYLMERYCSHSKVDEECECQKKLGIAALIDRILRPELIPETGGCGKCIGCPRCGYRIRSDIHPQSIHGSLGDYDQWKSIYLGLTISRIWYRFTDPISGLISWNRFQHLMNAMDEATAVAGVHDMLQLYPEIGAWITLEALLVAIHLQWPKMVAVITNLLEHRQQWFTPGGLSNLSETNVVYRDSADGLNSRIDLPMIAEIGSGCSPNYLRDQDSLLATTCNDYFIIQWLSTCDSDQRTDLIQLLGRALACCSAQWVSEERQSFHDEQQRRILGLIAHTDLRTFTSIYQTICHPSVYWHTRTTQQFCPKCQIHPPDLSDPTPRTPYEQVLQQAKLIRERKLRGVFYSGIKLLIIHHRLIERSYIPDQGWRYFKALADFNSRKTNDHI